MNYFADIRFVLADWMQHTGLVRDMTPSYFGIQYIRSGGFYLRMDAEKMQYGQGPAVFLTDPDHHFEYGSTGPAGRDHYWVCFQGERCRRYLNGGLFRVGRIQPVNDTVFFPRFRHLMELADAADRPHAVPVLEQILVMLEEESPMADDLRSPLMLLAERIAEAPGNDWDMADEAAHLHVSGNYFCRLFRKRFNTSPRQYLIHCRLRYAARLLLEPGISVREAAARCGIPDEHYFSRLFKRSYALSPREYRQEFGCINTSCAGRS